MNALGIASFTNLGYELHARRFESLDSDMSGRTVVVTGATGGLGLSAAASLAEMGARVVIVGRSQAKVEAAVDAVSGDAVGYRADLSSMSEVQGLARDLIDQEPRLDVLVNNVGVLIPTRSVTAEGLESTLATNLAGQFLLTNLLLPRLAQSRPSRIINVTSGGMYSQRIRPSDLQLKDEPYSGSEAYARTKRGQVILTEMWAAALVEEGVVVHAMHPGWARTAGVAESLPVFNRIMRPLLRSPEQGADTIVWLASDDEPLNSTGHLWFDRKRVDTHLTKKTVESAGDRELLWDRLVEITGTDLPASYRI